jgi:hypothetical protein
LFRYLRSVTKINLPTEKALQVRFDPKYLSKVRENTLSEINPDFEVVLKDARKEYTTKSVPSCVHVKFHAVLPVVKLGKFAMTMWHALDGKFAFNGVQQRNSMALVLPSDKHIRELLEDKEFIASVDSIRKAQEKHSEIITLYETQFF